MLCQHSDLDETENFGFGHNPYESGFTEEIFINDLVAKNSNLSTKNMFKINDKTEIYTTNFGAGSVISLDVSKNFAIIAKSEKSVGLLDLKTFTIFNNSFEVTDCNYLTEAEARSIVAYLYNHYALHWTFTDATLSTKGLKAQKWTI